MTTTDNMLQTDTIEASSSIVATTTNQTIQLTVPLTKKESRKQLNASIGPALKKYFKSAPIMERVAFCESTHTQFTSAGVVHRGVVNSKDVGIFQINERYHLKRSKDMGINIYSIEGNMEYAKILYEEQGLQPWSASKPCWGKYTELAMR